MEDNMGKGINKFLDMIHLSDDEDEFEDDLYDEEEEEDSPVRSFFSRKEKEEEPVDSKTTNFSETRKPKTRPVRQNSKLISLSNSRGMEVYVSKPQEFNDAQYIVETLQNGKIIVINTEGMELKPAQRIMDFISGACYALNGSLQAISNNIFIVAPENIDVSGDLRDELLNDSLLSPELDKF